MSSKFKKRLKQLHGSRQKRRHERSQNHESRVFTADDVEQTPPHDEDAASPVSTGDKEGHHAPAALLPPTSVLDAWRNHGAGSRATSHGEAYFIVRHHAEAHSHGDLRLVQGAAVDLDGFRKQLNDARLHSTDPSRLAFLDLETNGLSKSSFPFCIGIGLWEGSEFAVYHYFTPAEADEPAALSACAEILGDHDGLCTFNGSSFDVRMLKRRFGHHGIDHSLDELPHLDLLHLARKLLPERNGHKLSQLEEDVLGFRRTGDIPGAKIPGRWRDYLKAGMPQLLLDVFDHNRLDILSMVALLPALAAQIGGDMSPRIPRLADSERERLHSESAPKTKLTSQLSRTYALRSRAKSPDLRASTPRSDESVTRETIKLAGSFSRAKLRKGMPIGTKLRELREEAERLAERGVEEEALHILHLMVALSPRNPYALEKLVSYYRRRGEPAIADHFAKRLDEIAPY